MNHGQMNLLLPNWHAQKKYNCAIDLMYDYAQTPLDEKTITLTSFSSSDKLVVSYKAFTVSKDYRISLKNKCQTSLITPFEQGFSMIHIDEFLLL